MKSEPVSRTNGLLVVLNIKPINPSWRLAHDECDFIGVEILSNLSLYHYLYLNYLIYWCDRRLGSVFLHMIWRKSASYAKPILKHLSNRNRITGQLNFTPPLTALLLGQFGEKCHIYSGCAKPGTNPGAASFSGIV